MINKEGLCEAEVRKNLVLAEIGEPLTLPLARLNKSCEFKKEWDRIQDKWHGSNTKAKQKEYQKEYYQRPEVKAKQKEYNQRPEIKAKQKEYQKEYYEGNKNKRNRNNNQEGKTDKRQKKEKSCY